MRILIFLSCWTIALADDSYISHKYRVSCTEDYIPDNCNYPNITLKSIRTVEDLDRCGPALLPYKIRNLYWATTGRGSTYARNYKSLRRLAIVPRILTDISYNSLQVKLLGQPVSFPIGISATVAHRAAHVDGEIGTARAAASHGTVYIMSSRSQTLMEDIARAAYAVNPNAILWAETYITPNKSHVQQYLRRVENAGFKAIVVPVDSSFPASLSCNANKMFKELRFPNLYDGYSHENPSFTYRDLRWLASISQLPIVVRGSMTGEGAVNSIANGASAIFLSNQDGRHVDGELSVVEALIDVVDAMKNFYPGVDIYVDGGIRNGQDVFKVLALGAKAAFVGKPVIWGLAVGGEVGVSKMLSILKTEFNETMLLSGYNIPSRITRLAVRSTSEYSGWD